VQAARERIGAAALLVELAAGMQPREHDLEGGRLLDRMRAHGNAAAVVLHAYRPVVVHDDADVLRMAAERLVGGVVDHLLDDVQGGVGARVHARAGTNGLEALQHLD
jgi:hypothetical protein